jgi:hypothetical protein
VPRRYNGGVRVLGSATTRVHGVQGSSLPQQVREVVRGQYILSLSEA